MFTGIVVNGYQAYKDNERALGREPTKGFDEVKEEFYKLNSVINRSIDDTNEMWAEYDARNQTEFNEEQDIVEGKPSRKLFSKEYGFDPDTYFEQPEVIENIQKSKENFSEALDDIVWGQDKSGKKPVVLFKPTRIWTMVGLPDRKISFDKSKIKKVIKEHGLTIEDLKSLPEKLANPEFIFESATDDVAYVGVLDRNNEPFVAVVKPVGSDLKVTNIIKSAYNKHEGFVDAQIEAGRLLYDKTKPTEFRPHRALIAQGIPQSDNNNINQENINVNSKFYSKTQGEVFGSYDPLTREVELFKGQNPSTLTHELGHHFLLSHLRLIESMGLKDRNAPVFEWLSKVVGRDINSVRDMDEIEGVTAEITV